MKNVKVKYLFVCTFALFLFRIAPDAAAQTTQQEQWRQQQEWANQQRQAQQQRASQQSQQDRLHQQQQRTQQQQVVQQQRRNQQQLRTDQCALLQEQNRQRVAQGQQVGALPVNCLLELNRRSQAEQQTTYDQEIEDQRRLANQRGESPSLLELRGRVAAQRSREQRLPRPQQIAPTLRATSAMPGSPFVAQQPSNRPGAAASSPPVSPAAVPVPETASTVLQEPTAAPPTPRKKGKMTVADPEFRAQRTAIEKQRVEAQMAQEALENEPRERVRRARALPPDAPNPMLAKDKREAKPEFLMVGPLRLGDPVDLLDCPGDFYQHSDLCVASSRNDVLTLYVPSSKNPLPFATVQVKIIDHWLAAVTFTFVATPDPLSIGGLRDTSKLVDEMNANVVQAHKALRAKYGKPTRSQLVPYRNGYGATVREVEDLEWRPKGLHVTYTSGSHEDTIVVEFESVLRQRDQGQKEEEAKRPTL